LVIALACIVFGVGMAIRVCNDELRRQAANDSLTRRLTAEGRETEATVTGLRTGLGYVVSFDYAVDGRSFERSAFIASEHWQSLQVGSPLTICYLPSDPSKAYPDTDPPSSQSHWPTSLPMAGMILLFMLSFAAIFLSAILPQRRLLARGFPARGVITRCKEGSKGRSSGYYLNYDFPLQDGPSCQGKEFSGSQQAEGASVTVLYDPNNPRRNALYPLESVRMAAS
jgi:Protein of unknown function (DUF3592)